MKGIRRSIGVVLVGIAIFVGFSGTAHAAQQSTGEAENTLTADINQERTSRGLGALSVAADLVAFARQHSANMAAAGHPYHDPNIQTDVQNWQQLGDNVGSGASADALHTGFMNSQVHRDEILHPTYTEVGVGAFWQGDVLYVTEVFRLPERAAAPVVRAVTAPAPAPRAAPAPPVVVRSAAAATPAPTAPPTTAAPAPSTSTSVAVAAAPEWPPASLATQRTASHGANSTSISPVAVAAALLLMLVAGVEVRALRRRASRA